MQNDWRTLLNCQSWFRYLYFDFDLRYETLHSYFAGVADRRAPSVQRALQDLWGLGDLEDRLRRSIDRARKKRSSAVAADGVHLDHWSYDEAAIRGQLLYVVLRLTGIYGVDFEQLEVCQNALACCEVAPPRDASLVDAAHMLIVRVLRDLGRAEEADRWFASVLTSLGREPSAKLPDDLVA